MKLLAIPAALLIAGAFATAAQAQYQTPMYPEGYVGGDAMFWDLNPDGASSANSTGLRIRVHRRGTSGLFSNPSDNDLAVMRFAPSSFSVEQEKGA